ncbi:MAG: flap endonuclease [Myxococcales bacterium]|nr:flap endonuclease [Myxococcales bacterium]
MQVHLIDGTYELFRAWFGSPGARDARGREVGATRGLLSSLHALLRDEGVTHVACAFDHVIESFRNQLFAGYKTGEGIEPDLLAQFELAERAATALGVVVWPMAELEADDALASAAHALAADPRVERVVICSPDKDLAQCVLGERVVCFDRARKRMLDEAGVRERFGVPPSAIPDFLGLVGDDADGIPGIPRWGARSTATVLAHYGSIERIPDDSARWEVTVRGAASLARELSSRRDEAMLYKTLATLRRDAKLFEQVEALAWHGADRGLTEALCSEIGERSLPARVVRWRN